MSRRLGLAAGSLFVAVAAGACASAPPRSFADRFVRQADPDAEVVELLQREDGQPVTAPAEPAPPVELPAGTEPGKPAPKVIEGVTVESWDAGLEAALAAYAEAPGADTALAAGLAYARLRIWDAADEFLTRGLDFAPRDARLWAARARAWRDWGLPDLALGHATRAVYFAPASPDALNTLGTVLTMVGQLDAARTRFEQALTAEPTGAYILNNLCYVELAAGRPDAARARCEAALAIDPTLEAARENLERIGKSSKSFNMQGMQGAVADPMQGVQQPAASRNAGPWRLCVLAAWREDDTNHGQPADLHGTTSAPARPAC